MGQSLLLQSGLRRTVGAVVAARARRSDQRSGLLCQRGWPSSRRWCTTKKSGLSSTKSASSRAVAIASSCVSNSDSSAVFVTLPVATIRSRCWDLFNRWPFRKSRSFRDHDPSLLVGQLGNSPVGCAVPSGNSVVCSASCPASLRNWASRADSWALTRKFTRRRAGTPGGHPQRARRTPMRRGGRHARGLGSRRAPPQSSCLPTESPAGSRPDSADLAPSAGRGRPPGRT